MISENQTKIQTHQQENLQSNQQLESRIETFENELLLKVKSLLHEKNEKEEDNPQQSQ